jgi:Polyketide cyclase / dehydrase and lipid transport
MADVGNEPLWNPDALEVKRVDDGPIAPGAEWDGRYKGMGTMRVRLDEYERPRRLKLTTTGDKMDMQWTFDYSSPDGSKTHVEAHAQIQPKGAMRLMGPLMGPMIRRTFAKRPAQLETGLKRPAA